MKKATLTLVVAAASALAIAQVCVVLRHHPSAPVSTRTPAEKHRAAVEFMNRNGYAWTPPKQPKPLDVAILCKPVGTYDIASDALLKQVPYPEFDLQIDMNPTFMPIGGPSGPGPGKKIPGFIGLTPVAVIPFIPFGGDGPRPSQPVQPITPIEPTTPVATTPVPSSVFLLGTATLIAIFSAVRTKWRSA